jgi:hypothetical protein
VRIGSREHQEEGGVYHAVECSAAPKEREGPGRRISLHADADGQFLAGPDLFWCG